MNNVAGAAKVYSSYIGNQIELKFGRRPSCPKRNAELFYLSTTEVPEINMHGPDSHTYRTDLQKVSASFHTRFQFLSPFYIYPSRMRGRVIVKSEGSDTGRFSVYTRFPDFAVLPVLSLIS